MDVNMVHRQGEEERRRKAEKEAELKRCMERADWNSLKKVLPLGVKFSPSDTDLVDLLERKIARRDVFRGITCDFDIYTCHPENLHAKSGVYRHHDGKMYIFTPLRWQNESGKKIERVVTPNGHWKLSGSKSKESDHIENINGEKVATKASLAFHSKLGSNASNSDNNNGNGADGSNKEKKTKWLMQEYRLISPTITKIGGINIETALCVVYLHERGTNKEETGYRTSSSPEEEEITNGGGENGDQSINGGGPSVSPALTLPLPPPQNHNQIFNGFSTSHHHQQHHEPPFPPHENQMIHAAAPPPIHQSYPLHEYNPFFSPSPSPAAMVRSFNTIYPQNDVGIEIMGFGNNVIGENSNENSCIAPSGYLEDMLLLFNRKRPAENGL